MTLRDYKDLAEKSCRDEKYAKDLQDIELAAPDYLCPEPHVSADFVLCELLSELGYSQTVKAYKKLEESFSYI